jgi:DNA repair protein RadD
MLRDYQSKAVAQLRENYGKGKRAPLFVLPTGGGKTYVFCYIAQRLTAKSKRAVILTHRQELIQQSSRSLHNMNVPHGTIAPGYKYRRDPIAVASVQTLIRRLPDPDYNFDLVIVDEAHHAVAGTWRKILSHFPNARILGVTATPIRADGKGLGVNSGGIFDSLVEGPTIKQLIAQEHLVQPVVYAPPNRIDLKHVRMRGGDYNSRDLEGELDKPTITGDAVAHYARLCPFKPAVVFCASVKHAAHVAESFKAAGFTAFALDGTTSDTERRSVLAGLADGSVHVVTSCDLISEGTDIPAVEAAILLRPTQSEGLYLQQVGRALRPSAGKNHALILDHVGNCLIHGMPDDDREWSLDGDDKRRGKGKKKEAVIKDVQCLGVRGCFAYYRPYLMACPYCGNPREIRTREIKQVEGELKPLTPEELIQLQKMKRRENNQSLRFKPDGSFDEEESMKVLMGIGKQRGYANPYWWARKFLEGKGLLNTKQEVAS